MVVVEFVLAAFILEYDNSGGYENREASNE